SFVLEQESHDNIVQREQGDCPDYSAANRIVVSDDRVLNGVRQCQQHNEVKRVELSKLALSRKPEADHQKKVNNHRTQDLLDYRNIEVNNVIPDIRVHFLISSRIGDTGRIRSYLTNRTEMSRAPADPFLFDRVAAHLAHRAPRVARDQKIRGKFRLACGSDRSPENAPSLAMNSLNFVGSQTRCNAIGPHTRFKQNLVRVDVADACDHSLIHQQRFDPPSRPVFNQAFKKTYRKAPAQRLGPH